MRVAIFDHAVVPTNPSGGYHFRLLRGVCHEHEFTVFSMQFENPCPERIRWVRVPVPMRPGPLLLVAFWILAPVRYWWFRLRTGASFDLIQTAEGDVPFGDVCCAHFCFRGYLQNEWKRSRPQGLRRISHWLSYRLRAVAEPSVLRRADQIVVPSSGLQRELAKEYPSEAGKTHIIPSSVDTGEWRQPENFSRQDMRHSLGFGDEDVVLVFVALGSYERKGLPLLLEALTRVPEGRIKLLVVGGPQDLVRSYRSRAARMGLDGRALFLGMQNDVRPYLWAADAFALPSHYETFALVAFEAAAAGLPLLTTPLNGVEEFLRDGKNGILLEPSTDGVVKGLHEFLKFSAEERLEMGKSAQRDVACYDTMHFVTAWREFYAGLGRQRALRSERASHMNAVETNTR